MIHPEMMCVKPVCESVRIGEKQWIRKGAILLADVGKNNVISAGIVVVTVVPQGCWWAETLGQKLKR
jgi:acetyltransferase-like isoleucine patch superfamily enzyme